MDDDWRWKKTAMELVLWGYRRAIVVFLVGETLMVNLLKIMWKMARQQRLRLLALYILRKPTLSLFSFMIVVVWSRRRCPPFGRVELESTTRTASRLYTPPLTWIIVSLTRVDSTLTVCWDHSRYSERVWIPTEGEESQHLVSVTSHSNDWRWR